MSLESYKNFTMVVKDLKNEEEGALKSTWHHSIVCISSSICIVKKKWIKWNNVEGEDSLKCVLQ